MNLAEQREGMDIVLQNMSRTSPPTPYLDGFEALFKNRPDAYTYCSGLHKVIEKVQAVHFLHDPKKEHAKRFCLRIHNALLEEPRVHEEIECLIRRDFPDIVDLFPPEVRETWYQTKEGHRDFYGWMNPTELESTDKLIFNVIWNITTMAFSGTVPEIAFLINLVNYTPREEKETSLHMACWSLFIREKDVRYYPEEKIPFNLTF